MSAYWRFSGRQECLPHFGENRLGASDGHGRCQASVGCVSRTLFAICMTCVARTLRPWLIWGVFAFCAIHPQTHPNHYHRNNRQSQGGTLPCFPPKGGIVLASFTKLQVVVVIRQDESNLPMAVLHNPF